MLVQKCKILTGKQAIDIEQARTAVYNLCNLPPIFTLFLHVLWSRKAIEVTTLLRSDKMNNNKDRKK